MYILYSMMLLSTVYHMLNSNSASSFISIVALSSGAQPLASLVTTISPEAYGHARGLSVKHFGSKRMLHLEAPGEAAICTMVLCHRNQTMLSELKVNIDTIAHKERKAKRIR